MPKNHNYFSETPHIDSNAYVQAGVSATIAKASIRGELVVLNDQLETLLHYGVQDGDQVPELRFSASSRNDFLALEGGVVLSAAAKSKSYEKTLFDWPGISHEDFIFDISDRVAIMQ